MLETILSALLGGTTGLIGSLLTGVMGVWKAKLDMEQKKLDYAHAFDLHRMNLEERRIGFEHEMEMAEMTTAASMRTASYEHDSKTGQASQWVTDVLRLVRPVLTLALIIIVASIYFWSGQDYEAAQITDTVTYAMTSAVLWWFGDRAQKR